MLFWKDKTGMKMSKVENLMIFTYVPNDNTNTHIHTYVLEFLNSVLLNDNDAIRILLRTEKSEHLFH